MRACRFAVTMLAVVALGACTPTVPDLGFAVALTIKFDDSVSDAALASVQSFSMQITGDDTYGKLISLGRPANRVERVPYYPTPGTSKVAIAVTAETSTAVIVATGSSGTITMKPGKTSVATAELSALNALPDLGVPDQRADDGGAAHDDGGDNDAGTHGLTLALEGAATYAASGATPSAVAAVDVNGDGILDIVTLNTDGHTLDVRLGKTDGTLGPLVTTTLTAGSSLMATGDFDGDHHLDVAIASSLSTAVQIWSGDGAGAFTKGTSVDEGITPVALAAADFDVDGAADLAIVGATSNAVVFSANTSTVHKFAANTNSTQSAVVIGDINGDKLPDLVILQPSAFGVEVVLDTNTTSKRSFAPVVFSVTGDSTAGYALLAIATGDIDGDGLEDIATSTDRDNVHFCYGRADGTCAKVNGINVENSAQIGLVDVDGDHHADLVMTHSDTARPEGVGVCLYASPGPLFADETLYALGTRSGPLAIGDLDRDGTPDFVVANEANQSVSVWYNTTPVHDPLVVDISGEAYFDVPLVGDFNRDGFLDVLAGASGRNFLTLLRGNGDGTFAPFNNSTDGLGLPVTTDEIDALTTGDIDNDGVADVLIAGTGTANVLPVSKGGAFGSSTRTTYDATYAAVAIATGDLNNDGKLDVAISRGQSDSAIYIFYGDGTTTLPPPTVVTVDSNLSSNSLAIGDVDGDKLPDLVVASAGHNGVVVFLQTSTHTLAMQPPATLLGGARVVRLADFDGDSKLDVALAGTGGLVTALNAGKGTFTFSQKLGAGVEIDDVVVADLTNDGQPDLVTVSQATFAVTAFQNLGATFGGPQSYTAGGIGPSMGLATGDFDRDGRVDVVLGGEIEAIVRIRNVSK